MGKLLIILLLLASLGFIPVGIGEVNISPIDGIVSISTRAALAASLEPGVEVASTVAQQAEPGELIGNRTQNSKTFSLGAGRYALDVSIEPKHYLDVGQWKDIDNRLWPTVAPWNWLMNWDGYQVLIKNDLTAGQILEYSRNFQSVTFQPMALQWTNDLDQISQISMPATGTLSVVGNEIKWTNGYGVGRDFLWRAEPGVLRKLLIVNSTLPTPPAFITSQPGAALELNFIFDPSSSLDIYIDGVLWPNSRPKRQTFNNIEFRVGTEVLWIFRAPTYGDSARPQLRPPKAWTVLKKSGNSLYVSVRVPYSWLQTATYPIYIDPTLDYQVGAGADDGKCEYVGGVPDWFDATSNLIVGNYTGTVIHSFARWPGVTIPAGSTITSNTYIQHRTSDWQTAVLTNIYFNDVAAPTAPTDGASFDAKVKTTAFVAWDFTPTANAWNTSPGLASIIQELVNSYSYASGAAMQLLHWDDGSTSGDAFQINSYDNNTTYAPKLHIEYAVPNISNTPTSKAFGVVAASSSYWSNGSAPTWPLGDAGCYFTVTNNGSGAVNITIKATNFTGGVGWTLASSPGVNIVTVKAGKSGDANEAAMITLTTAEQAFITGLAASATKKWEVKLGTGTFTDGVAKTSTVTLTASVP